MKVGIAGGGIMGQLLAFSLVNAGYEVVIFDAASDNNCSAAAAGLLTPMAELEKSAVMISDMGMEALSRLWPAILQRLPEEVYFRSAGSVAVSHPRDHLELQRVIKQINVKARFEVERLDDVSLTALEPQLSKFTDGYYFKDEGQIDAQHCLQVLRKYLLSNAVEYRMMIVKNISSRCIDADNVKHQFDLVFDCRGLGAKEDIPHLRGVRGELLWLHAPHVHITRPVRLYHPRYRLYLVPRPDRVYLIGASEIECEDYSNISLQTSLELMSAVYSIHSGFADARFIRAVTQCRPTFMHHYPQINVEEGLIAVNGLYRHGFLIAPALVEEVMKYIATGEIGYKSIWRQREN